MSRPPRRHHAAGLQHATMGWRRSRWLLLLVAAITFGAATACGDDPDGPPPEDGAVPAVDEPGFRDDQTFQQIPRFPDSDELTPASQENGVVSQSFEIQNRAPLDVIEFYQSEFAGQAVLDPLEEIGPDSYRIDFAVEDSSGEIRRLRLTTTPLEPTTTGTARAQYSLVLYPDASDPDQDL